MSDHLLDSKKIVIIGGCGHVGLPLGIKFALAGATTKLLDVDARAVEMVNAGRMPFLDEGGETQLGEALTAGMTAVTDPGACREADVYVFVTGTPVDEHLNPELSELLGVIDQYHDLFADHSLIVMRSTLYPGTMEFIHKKLRAMNRKTRLAFCPERVAQGQALKEIESLPQIVAAFDEDSFEAAYELFAELAPAIVRLTPLEAELAKLMTNTWRYLEFAIANEFYMIAETNGIDFHRIYKAIRHEYPRADSFKAPGFTGGPCLFKDTMQLASYYRHRFHLGHTAMLANEGLATFVVEKAAAALGSSLWGRTAGLLGMAFKADNDDTRESLSYRVKKGLEFGGARVVYHDPYLEDARPVKAVLDESDVLILCVPHREYRALKIEKPVVDVWGILHEPDLEIRPGRSKRPKGS